MREKQTPYTASPLADKIGLIIKWKTVIDINVLILNNAVKI